MNEREKLLQQLDQSYEEKKEEYSDVKPYKATTNFNTALNQPQINVNDVTNLNIQNNEMVNKAMGINNLMETNVSNQNQNVVMSNNNTGRKEQSAINKINNGHLSTLSEQFTAKIDEPSPAAAARPLNSGFTFARAASVAATSAFTSSLPSRTALARPT